MIEIYGDTGSGNCLKVKYLCDHLGLAYKWLPVDIMEGESRTPAFLSLSPMGQVPIIRLPGGQVLAQSNAILTYLAEGSALLPTPPLARAKVLEWLFWEQYSFEPYIAVSRFQMVYQGRRRADREAWRVERGEASLRLMEAHLRQQTWFAGDTFTIADIALLAYARLAPEGGFDLTPLPAVRDWIERCETRLAITPLDKPPTQ